VFSVTVLAQEPALSIYVCCLQKMFQRLHSFVYVKKMFPEISRVYHSNLLAHCLSFALV
jgi:uncharacterized membrane protein YbaN (DUF454 family)